MHSQHIEHDSPTSETKNAERLVSELSYDEFIRLLHVRLKPLPKNATPAYQQIHKILSHGSKENATEDEIKYAGIMRRTLLTTKAMLFALQHALQITPAEVNQLICAPLEPLPDKASKIYHEIHKVLNDGSKENATDKQIKYATAMRHVLQYLFKLIPLTEKLVSELTLEEVKKLLYVPLEPLPEKASKSYQEIHKILSNYYNLKDMKFVNDGCCINFDIMRKALIERQSKDPFPLDLLPYDILNLFPSFFDPILLSKTSKKLYTFYREPSVAAKLLFLIKKYNGVKSSNKRKETCIAYIKKMVMNNPSLLFLDIRLQLQSGTYEIISILKFVVKYCDLDILILLHDIIINTQNKDIIKIFTNQLNELQDNTAWNSYTLEDIDQLKHICSQHSELLKLTHVLDATKLLSFIQSDFAIAEEVVTKNPSLMLQNIWYKNSDGSYEMISPLKFAVQYDCFAILTMFHEKIKNTDKDKDGLLKNFTHQLDELKDKIVWIEYSFEEIMHLRNICLQHPRELSDVVNVLDAAKFIKLLDERRSDEAERLAKSNPSLMFQNVWFKKSNDTYKMHSLLKHVIKYHNIDVLKMFHKKIQYADKNKDDLKKSFASQLKAMKDNITWNQYTLNEIKNIRNICLQYLPALSDVVNVLDAAKFIKLLAKEKIDAAAQWVGINPSLMFQNIWYKKSEGSYATISLLKYVVQSHDIFMLTMFHNTLNNALHHHNNELKKCFTHQLNELKDNIVWSEYSLEEIDHLKNICSQHSELSDLVNVLDAAKTTKTLDPSATNVNDNASSSSSKNLGQGM